MEGQPETGLLAGEKWSDLPVGQNPMDYSLAALKLLASQLEGSTSFEGSSPAQMLLVPSYSISRKWVICPAFALTARCGRQGGVVRADCTIGDARLFVDDGASSVTELMLRPEDAKGPWRPGMYGLIIGAYIADWESLPMVKVHKIVDLSAQPDREAMWYMEVAEAYNFFNKAVASRAGSPP
ncbi:uncharacterized protein [Triticum aestivum]|uniref:uncharacterized protein n=1 Tax=Triticum aestivum TaxID=4565 RepID=UPI001D029BD6|nr:uncharacterized protein LOC123076595 [Triticum aestivum]